MKAWISRGIALVLGSSIAVVGTLVAATCFHIEPLHARIERTWRSTIRDDEMRLASHGTLRDAAVRAELALLDDDGWPGVYRSAEKWPTELVLAPQAGFTLFHHSKCGNCEGFAAFGRVVAASEHELQLETELSHECATTRDHLATTLHLVRWGELLFAVTPQRVEDFCAAVTDGQSFPREPLRVLGDAAFDFDAPTRPDTRPDTRPVVPSEWQRLLPAAPIDARIEALLELRPRESGANSSVTYYDAEFELDRGADAGLTIGMHVYVEPRPSRLVSRARIDEVERRSARFTLFVDETERAWAEALIGTRVSTLHPRAPR
ncbi:MAG: hypothetical protein L6Q99_09340 [Planctomycetes bacterium]|nr:hypothetical protein [Planctomycetota bacterium]